MKQSLVFVHGIPFPISPAILDLSENIRYTIVVVEISRSGGTGRRARLKIVFPQGVWVRFPPSA